VQSHGAVASEFGLLPSQGKSFGEARSNLHGSSSDADTHLSRDGGSIEDGLSHCPLQGNNILGEGRANIHRHGSNRVGDGAADLVQPVDGKIGQAAFTDNDPIVQSVAIDDRHAGNYFDESYSMDLHASARQGIARSCGEPTVVGGLLQTLNVLVDAAAAAAPIGTSIGHQQLSVPAPCTATQLTEQSDGFMGSGDAPTGASCASKACAASSSRDGLVCSDKPTGEHISQISDIGTTLPKGGESSMCATDCGIETLLEVVQELRSRNRELELQNSKLQDHVIKSTAAAREAATAGAAARTLRDLEAKKLHQRVNAQEQELAELRRAMALLGDAQKVKLGVGREVPENDDRDWGSPARTPAPPMGLVRTDVSPTRAGSESVQIWPPQKQAFCSNASLLGGAALRMNCTMPASTPPMPCSSPSASSSVGTHGYARTQSPHGKAIAPSLGIRSSRPGVPLSAAGHVLSGDKSAVTQGCSIISGTSSSGATAFATAWQFPAARGLAIPAESAPAWPHPFAPAAMCDAPKDLLNQPMHGAPVWRGSHGKGPPAVDVREHGAFAATTYVPPVGGCCNVVAATRPGNGTVGWATQALTPPIPLPSATAQQSGLS